MLETNRAAYRQRRDLLLAGLNELGLVCEIPAGAFYAFPDVSRISNDSREAAEILLERAQVATVPGVVFGEHGEGHLRFSFSTSIENIEAGLDSLRRNLVLSFVSVSVPQWLILMNEFDFIKKIRKRAREIGDSAGLVRGIGDDAAVLKSSLGADVVVSADLLIEDIDFRRDTTLPALLGHKALAVSLSDIAAMGARPRWSLLSIGVPQDEWEAGFPDQFYEGFFRLADRYGVKLIGGDLSRAPEKIVIDSIIIGECLPGREVFRSGAQPGDQIFVTGFLGDASAGLRLIERGARLHLETAIQSGHTATADLSSDQNSIDHLLLRQLRPEPRVGWGLLIGGKQLATAMIDISDGLSSDLNHLCDESKVGALVDAARIPIDPLVTDLADAGPWIL